MIADRILIENNEIVFRLDMETAGANAAELAVRARDEAVDARDVAVQKANEAVDAASQAISAKDEVEIIGNQVSEDRIAVASDREAVELARADVEEKAGIAEQAADLAELAASKFQVIDSIEDLPDPEYGATVLIPDPSMGAAWSDGLGWRWYKNNEPLEVAWNDILLQAKQDGWSALYDFGNKKTLTIENGRVTRIKSLIGNYQDIVKPDPSIQAPSLGGKIGDMDSAVFTGVENMRMINQLLSIPSLFIMAVYRYDGPSESNVFIFDGRTSTGRLALLTSGALFKNFSFGEESVADLDNLPHVTGMQLDIDGGITWHDGDIVGVTRSYGPNRNPIVLGADYQNNRKWIGDIACLLIYEGVPSREVIRKMNKKLMKYSGAITKEREITVNSYATIKISDSSVIQSFNGDSPLNVASITKLMTLVVANDYISDFLELVTITSSDIQSSLTTFVQENDVVSFEDLFAASVIVSDNNAPIALARIIGYIIDPEVINDNQARAAFYQKMDEKALSIGLADSSFTSAYTNGMMTAKDVTILVKYIDENIPEIYNYWGLLTYVVNVSGVNARSYTVSSTISQSSRMILPELIGGKTGTADYLGSVAFVWEDHGDRYATAVLQSDPHDARFKNARYILDELY